VGRNPFNTYDSTFNTGFEQRPKDVVGARSTVSPDDLAQQQAAGANIQVPAPVSLPPHLFIPKTARSVNLFSIIPLGAGATLPVLQFACPQGTKTHFFSYAIYTNAVDPTTVTFNPTVNGIRAFPYHGTPVIVAAVPEYTTPANTPTAIVFSAPTTDLSNVSLIEDN